MAMGDQVEDTKAKDLQIAALEKQQILEFESYLAAASTKQTITEQTSLLLSQLITMDPSGHPRKPPPTVLEQLQALNSSHKLGHLLCRSRHPDFLLDIIQRQGASQSMPWLADLVESSEGALSHLPVQCLCEFLLSSGTLVQPEKQHKHQQLLQHLQMVLTDVNQDPQAPCEVLEYFLRRLSSPQATSRAQAIKDMAQLIVERSSIVAAILPAPDHEVPGALGTQNALMLMFYVTLFENLLETWFPLGKEPPKAYLVDTSEEALLIPDWLKLRMISYMAQLVEVQHHRGATGGQMLVQVVQLEQPKLPEYSRLCSTTPRQTMPITALTTKDGTRCKDLTDGKQVVPVLLQLFGGGTLEPEWSKAEKQQAFRTLQKTLAVEHQTVSEKKVLNTTIAFFNEMLTSSRSTQFLTSLLNIPQQACPLLRLMTTDSQSPISRLERTGQLLLDEGLKLHRTEELVEAMSKLLLQDTTESLVQTDKTAIIPERTGLLIDWLASVEPELIGSCTPLQTLALVGYIVEEALLGAQEDATQCHQGALDVMESRLPLLLQCTTGGQEMAPSEIAHQLLLKLYLRIPGMIQHLVDVELDKFLSKACVTDVYSALQELDHLSSRKPSILDTFCEPISELLLSPTGNIRNLAHVLLSRHLRHNPAAASTSSGLAAFLRCLESDQADILNTALERLPDIVLCAQESDQADILNTALERLPDIVLCAQEHALPLLQKVFNLGMCSNVNTVSHISKTIALLNVQTGC
ncbi:hypothetical protein C0J52_18275 [Blattella germanica]|nr:hypothetical protein C0J52_18275 [Blattella germanica]